MALPALRNDWRRHRILKALHGPQGHELLDRTGEFWQTEYWDRFIRNDEHFAATEGIDNNPVKAGLVAEPRPWPYGSARLKT